MSDSDYQLIKLNDLKPDCEGETHLIGVTWSISSPILTRGFDKFNNDYFLLSFDF